MRLTGKGRREMYMYISPYTYIYIHMDIDILYQLDIEMEIQKVSKKEITRREMNTGRETNTSNILSRESKAQISRKMLKSKE